MKKLPVTLALSGLLLLTFGVTGCSGGNEAVYRAIPYYDSTEYLDGSNESYYNTELFRRNDSSQDGADPAIIQITDPDDPNYGDFVMYITSSGFRCYLSDDLENWRSCGPSLSDEANATGFFYADYWAPSVVYDEADGMYYMFCSGTPKNGGKVNGLVYCLVSDSAFGPFDFAPLPDEARAGTYTRKDDTVITYDDAWASQMLFDPAKFAECVENKFTEMSGNEKLYDTFQLDDYFSTIDPYAFIDVDEDGVATRYLYFVFRNPSGKRYIAGVECGDTWTDIRYETMTLLTYAGYMDVQGTTECLYQVNVNIDEGPVMLEHNGMYYLTYSFGAASGDYQVGQAVSDSPLGVFRKLDESENGIILSHDFGGFDLTGPGGHGFIEVDGELYIIYHRHSVANVADLGDRCIGVDKVEWVTIENINGEQMDVLYVNGPTLNLQPKFEFVSEYKNIADEATVTAKNMEEGSTVDAMTDGLLSMYQYIDVAFNEKYIHETYFDDTATITLSFDDYRTVRAIMIYDSKYLSCSYLEIKRIEFDCIDENGNEVINYISNLQMDWRGNRHSLDATYSIKNAAAAIAEFDEIRCKTIRITIEIPDSGWIINEDGTISYGESYMMFEHENRIGISEITVLGK